MTFTNKQIKEANRNLAPEVQDFIMSNENTELISNYLSEAGLSEDQTNSADSEILYAMLGLQTLETAIGNIAKLSNKSIENLHKLKLDLEYNIFAKLPKSNQVPQRIENSVQTETPKIEKSSGVGNDFEQIMLNQAKAMQPAVALEEQSSQPSQNATASQVGVAKPAVEAPENLPGVEMKPKEKLVDVPDYKPGEDPYRESAV